MEGIITTSKLPWFLGKGSQYTYISEVPYLVLDWETTNLEFGSPLNEENKIVLGCWKLVLPDGTIRDKYRFGDEYEMQSLLDDIDYVNKHRGFIVAHNLKFELQWLKRCGLCSHAKRAFPQRCPGRSSLRRRCRGSAG